MSCICWPTRTIAHCPYHPLQCLLQTYMACLSRPSQQLVGPELTPCRPCGRMIHACQSNTHTHIGCIGQSNTHTHTKNVSVKVTNKQTHTHTKMNRAYRDRASQTRTERPPRHHPCLSMVSLLLAFIGQNSLPERSTYKASRYRNGNNSKHELATGTKLQDPAQECNVRLCGGGLPGVGTYVPPPPNHAGCVTTTSGSVYYFVTATVLNWELRQFPFKATFYARGVYVMCYFPGLLYTTSNYKTMVIPYLGASFHCTCHYKHAVTA